MESLFHNLPSSGPSKETARRIHHMAGRLSVDHVMHDVNDALTAILAICDTEAKNAVPKIKKNIRRINQSLRLFKNNHHTDGGGDAIFNINSAVHNIMEAVRDYYGENITVEQNVQPIRPLVRGNQFAFERLLLVALMHLAESPENGAICFEMNQKNNEAKIVLKKTDAIYMADQWEEWMDFSKIFSGNAKIAHDEKGIEIIFMLPIHVGSEEWMEKDAMGEDGRYQPATHRVISFKEKKAFPAVYSLLQDGAQERT